MTTFVRGFVPDDPEELKRYLEEMGRRLEEAFNTIKPVETQEEGVRVGDAGNLNFIGDSVTAALNATTGAIDVTVTGDTGTIPDPTTYDVTVAAIAGFPTCWGFSDGTATVNPKAGGSGGSVAPTTIPNGAAVNEIFTYGLGPTFNFAVTGDVGENYVDTIEQVGYETFTVGAGAGYVYAYNAVDDMTRWYWAASGMHWNIEAGNNHDVIVTWGTDAATAGGGGGGGFTLDTKVNLAAQTSVDFSSLPADIKTVHVTFKSLSTGSSGSLGRPILRIGSGGVPRVSGQYVGGIGQIATVSGSGGSIFGIELALSSTWTAAQSISGQVIFTLHDAATNEWCWSGSLFSSSVSSVTWVTQGTVNLLGVLDIIRLTTIGGTATLDAGSINIAYST